MAAPGYDVRRPATHEHAAVITPHDSTLLSTPANALYVGGTGNITALLTDGTTVLFSAIPVGKIIPLRVARVNATGTTATLIVGLW
jgi:hypothetical protein